MISFLQLPGPWTQTSQAPDCCASCTAPDLYRQPDFRRSFGLAIITIASLLTCVLFYYGCNWFLVWSPMLAVVLLDRVFAVFSPTVILCYQCGHVHRGPAKVDTEKYPVFDLEVYDRLHYAERTGTTPQ